MISSKTLINTILIEVYCAGPTSRLEGLDGELQLWHEGRGGLDSVRRKRHRMTVQSGEGRKRQRGIRRDLFNKRENKTNVSDRDVE